MDTTLNSAFAGRHVTILSSTGMGQERTDTGTLVAMEANWIQLAKDNGEMLLFPSTAIRVIKLLDVEPPYSAVKESIPALPGMRAPGPPVAPAAPAAAPEPAGVGRP
jgi:hypothetical protein